MMKKAFTLIELLISIIFLGFITVTLYNSIKLTKKTYNQYKINNNNIIKYKKIYSLLNDDIKNARKVIIENNILKIIESKNSIYENKKINIDYKFKNNKLYRVEKYIYENEYNEKKEEVNIDRFENINYFNFLKNKSDEKILFIIKLNKKIAFEL